MATKQDPNKIIPDGMLHGKGKNPWCPGPRQRTIGTNES